MQDEEGEEEMPAVQGDAPVSDLRQLLSQREEPSGLFSSADLRPGGINADKAEKGAAPSGTHSGQQEVKMAEAA